MWGRTRYKVGSKLDRGRNSFVARLHFWVKEQGKKKKGKLKYVQPTLPYWCLMSRFWRESISQGFIFVISVGNYLKGYQISQFKRSHLNLLVPNFPTFGNCTKDIP